MSGDTDAATSPLQALFEELETLYRTAPIGIGLVDRELKFVRVNDRLAEYAGMPAEEMLGRTPSEIAPEIGPKVEPIYRRVIETGEPVLDAAVTGATRADPGRERHWLASYSPLVSADAEIQGVSIIVRDITELKQVQQRLEERVALVRLVANVATQFVGILSHELGSRMSEALRCIAEFFEADVARLGFVTLDGRILPTAHAWFSDRLDADELAPYLRIAGPGVLGRPTDRRGRPCTLDLRVSKFAATLRYSRPSTPSPANSNTI